MPREIHESTTSVEATPTAGGLLEVEFITPGWGSSGYYSREVVEAAAPLFAVGTHLYFDHPTAEELSARPERSVRDLAAVVVEAGTVNPDTGGIRGTVRPLALYAPLLTDPTFTESVGLSIRGAASDVVEGEAEGRRGPIIEGLAHITSVDFVTRAGRGGRVLQVLESQRPEVIDRALARGVAEATADERRQQLSDAVRTTYGSDERYAWVRDFDDTTVWFEAYADDEASQTWQQSYTVTDDDTAVTLTGARTEVRATTRYVPVTRPGSTTTAQESEEDAMPNIQIEESEHTRLVETAGRVPTLESERATAIRERDEALNRLASRDRIDRARAIIAERATATHVTFSALEERGLLAGLPVADDGALDEAAFTTAVNEAAAEKTPTSGGITGFGGTTPVGESTAITFDDIDKALGRVGNGS